MARLHPHSSPSASKYAPASFSTDPDDSENQHSGSTPGQNAAENPLPPSPAEPPRQPEWLSTIRRCARESDTAVLPPDLKAELAQVIPWQPGWIEVGTGGRAFGTTSGCDLETEDFWFPMFVCNGCAVASPDEQSVTAQYPTVTITAKATVQPLVWTGVFE